MGKLLSCPQKDRRYEGEIWLYHRWVNSVHIFNWKETWRANLPSGNVFSLLRTFSWLNMGPKKDSNKKRSRSQLLLSKMSQHCVWKLWVHHMGYPSLKATSKLGQNQSVTPGRCVRSCGNTAGPHPDRAVVTAPSRPSGFLKCRAQSPRLPLTVTLQDPALVCPFLHDYFKYLAVLGPC